jgi:hypothetical protein
MDAQLRVETGSFVPCGVETGHARGEEDAVHETAAQRQERERRRIEFRSSLHQAQAKARTLLMRAQTGAEVRETRGMRMAELAQA